MAAARLLPVEWVRLFALTVFQGQAQHLVAYAAFLFRLLRIAPLRPGYSTQDAMRIYVWLETDTSQVSTALQDPPSG